MSKKTTKPETSADEALFLGWLEHEHPAHSHWDHPTKGAYESWIGQMRTAFNAGRAHPKPEGNAKIVKDAQQLLNFHALQIIMYGATISRLQDLETSWNELLKATPTEEQS